MYSTVPAVEAQLVEQLQARLDDKNVVVHRGHPGRQAESEAVWLGDAYNSEQDPASIGNRTRDESYLIEVVFDVVRRGAEPEVVRARAYELAVELEALLRETNGLSGAFTAGNGWGQVRGFTSTTNQLDEKQIGIGYRHTLIAQVEIWARV